MLTCLYSLFPVRKLGKTGIISSHLTVTALTENEIAIIQKQFLSD